MIGRILREAVHAHGGRHQRHIVHHSAGEANEDDDHIEPPHGPVQPLGQRRQDMGVLKARDRQKDADEKHHRAHVDAAESMHEGQRLLGVILLVAMDEVAHQPQDAQPEEDAQKGRQMGCGLEGWNGHQNAQAQVEHQAALEGAGGGAAAAIILRRRLDRTPAQVMADNS